jgi:hypothetical protein
LLTQNGLIGKSANNLIGDARSKRKNFRFNYEVGLIQAKQATQEKGRKRKPSLTSTNPSIFVLLFHLPWHHHDNLMKEENLSTINHQSSIVNRQSK